MDRRAPRIEGFALGRFCGLTGGSELLGLVTVLFPYASATITVSGFGAGEGKPCATGTGLGSGRGKAECSAIGMIHGASGTGTGTGEGMCTGLTFRGTPSGTRLAARSARVRGRVTGV